MPIFELLPDIYVPTFEMLVGSTRLPLPIARTIMDVSVTEHLNPPGEFSFRLNDPTLTFINKQDGRFNEGRRVEISIGYVGDTRTMIVGEIAGLTADFPSSGPAALEVTGFDVLHSLTRGTVYRTFTEPDSQIVSQIASEMGLTPSVDSTSVRTEPRVQKHVTNLKFLEQLAHANGYFVWVDGDTLYFKRQPPVPNTIQLEWGKTLVSFSPRLSTAGQVNAIEVRGWDPIQKQSFSARAQSSRAADLAPTGQQQIARGAGGRSERVVVCDTNVSSTQEAQALAERMVFDQQQASITGSGTSVGKPDMRVGTILELSGIGRFNGPYEVKQVTHAVGGSGYQTSFQVVRKQS